MAAGGNAGGRRSGGGLAVYGAAAGMEGPLADPMTHHRFIQAELVFNQQKDSLLRIKDEAYAYYKGKEQQARLAKLDAEFERIEMGRRRIVKAILAGENPKHDEMLVNWNRLAS